MGLLGSLPARMGRAVTLEADLYEEVEAEPSALRQAWVIVLGVCLTGAGGRALHGDAGLIMALEVVEPLVLWLGGSAFAYMVGATFLRGPETETDYAEVLRTTGFAFTPGLLKIFGFLEPAWAPWLGLSITLLARTWILLCGVVAVRQALDFTTLRAVGTFGSAFLLLLLAILGLNFLLAGLPL